MTITHSFRAQIQVDNTLTPDELVEIIIGQGVAYSNVTFVGEPVQFGSFDENNGGLGIANGIIMGSGDVELAEGPNDNDGATEGSFFNTTTDSDLEDIAGVSINDVAVLEFDFVPMGNSITFHYVFGSEEYNEYVCAEFNDAFGFFLSGPGINGTYSSPGGFPGGSVNLALIPGTNVGVSIGTVNNGTPGFAGEAANCENLDPNWEANTIYFVDNAGSSTIQYDGMTVVMEASYEVQCGETYHIKIAIGDGGDSSLDSGVFIEENSFSSEVPVAVNFNFTQETEIENGIYEGCGEITMEFVRQDDNLDDSLTVSFQFAGDAENGTDYEFPSEIIFQPGDSTMEISFSAFADNLTEDIENILLSMNFTGECLAQEEIEIAELFIINTEPLTVNTTDVTICGDEIIELIPEVSGGIAPLMYNWSNGETSPTINVSGDGPTQYTVTVTDNCPDTPPVEGIFNLSVGEGPQVSYPPGSVEIMCEETVEIECDIEGAYETIIFETDQGDVIGTSNPAIYNTGVGAASLTVTVTDICNTSSQVVIPISYVDPPALEVELGEDINASCVDQVMLEPNIVGGEVPFSYTWIQGQTEVSNEMNYTITTSHTTTLLFEITDACGQVATDEITIHIPNDPIVLEVSDDLTVCFGTEVTLSAEATGGEGNFTYYWASLGEGQTQTFTAIESKEYTVTAIDVCGNSYTKTVRVEVNSFSVNYIMEEKELNEYYFEALTFPGCDGDCLYYWEFGDNDFAYGETAMHTYDGLDEYHGFLSVINQQGCKDSVQFTVFPPINIFVPTAFTPNGDGINDVFNVHGIGVSEFEIEIYNRWGQIVYQSNDLNFNWLGEASNKLYYTQNELYNYRITAKGYTPEIIFKTGVIAVIR